MFRKEYQQVRGDWAGQGVLATTQVIAGAIEAVFLVGGEGLESIAVDLVQDAVDFRTGIRIGADVDPVDGGGVGFAGFAEPAGEFDGRPVIEQRAYAALMDELEIQPAGQHAAQVGRVSHGKPGTASRDFEEDEAQGVDDEQPEGEVLHFQADIDEEERDRLLRGQKGGDNDEGADPCGGTEELCTRLNPVDGQPGETAQCDGAGKQAQKMAVADFGDHGPAEKVDREQYERQVQETVGIMEQAMSEQRPDEAAGDLGVRKREVVEEMFLNLAAKPVDDDVFQDEGGGQATDQPDERRYGRATVVVAHVGTVGKHAGLKWNH